MIGGLSLFPRLGGEFSAQAGRGQYLGACDNADHNFARARRQAGQPDAQRISFVSRGSPRGVATRPSRRWHRDNQFFSVEFSVDLKARCKMAGGMTQ